MLAIETIWPLWKVESILGEGHFGKVYKLKREEFGHFFYCAAKEINIPKDQQSIQQLRLKYKTNQELQEYFKSQVSEVVNEIKIMENLKSAKNIVAIEDYAVIPHDDQIGYSIFIRMELLESLPHYLKNNQIKINEIVQLGIDICIALDYCSRYQIIHRDIKFDNIFRNRFGDYKLGDFGISKHANRDDNQVIAGTQAYMAPEMFKHKGYDKTVDIYALGIVLYKLLNNGKIPFVDDDISSVANQKAIQQRIVGQPIPPPLHGDQELIRIVLKACAFDKNQRYQNAHDMLKDLNNYKDKKSKKNIVKKPKFCPRCGTRVKGHFCSKCGYNFIDRTKNKRRT